ncbi:hypothetical protein HNQ81_001118 [Desulfoprunum benzoelyticum]|uniref:Uncharacterized protein n=1 Tax=Desulfoprunum benzoelyticum TaxID=1506996 RepID=A0A840UNQ2_9BACT|nr:hypothetical protein [Desulfoprunum benzoelyticum]
MTIRSKIYHSTRSERLFCRRPKRVSAVRDTSSSLRSIARYLSRSS